MDVSSVVKNQLLDWEINKNDGIIVAVSGGVDSMVLLHSLHTKKQRIHVAHVNYHLRGEDSDQDQTIVEEYCTSNNIAFTVFHADPKDLDRNLQERAREFRYKKFKHLLEELEFKYIATAHHLNDSLETFFINLSRGSGLNGLTGIHGKTNNIIRPIIHLTQKEVLDFAIAKKISWREDKSNHSLKYIRNVIRHKIIPEIENLEDRSIKAVYKSIVNLEKDNALMEENIGILRDKWTYEKNGLIYLDLMEWRQYQNKTTLLFHLLQPFGFSNIDQIYDAIGSQPGKKFSAKDYTLWLDRDQIILQEHSKIQDFKDIQINKDQVSINAPINLSFHTLNSKDFETARFAPELAWLDQSKLKFPLTIRKWKHGDRFKPLGMKGMKKISDFLIDLKMPLPEKENTLVLESDGEIVWLIQHRIDDRYKITDATQNVYLVKLEQL